MWFLGENYNVCAHSLTLTHTHAYTRAPLTIPFLFSSVKIVNAKKDAPFSFSQLHTHAHADVRMSRTQFYRQFLLPCQRVTTRPRRCSDNAPILGHTEKSNKVYAIALREKRSLFFCCCSVCVCVLQSDDWMAFEQTGVMAPPTISCTTSVLCCEFAPFFRRCRLSSWGNNKKSGILKPKKKNRLTIIKYLILVGVLYYMRESVVCVWRPDTRPNSIHMNSISVWPRDWYEVL